MQSSNARLGLKLFMVYLALYSGFVLISAFAPEVMERTPIAGLTLPSCTDLGSSLVHLLCP